MLTPSPPRFGRDLARYDRGAMSPRLHRVVTNIPGIADRVVGIYIIDGPVGDRIGACRAYVA